MPHRAAGVAMRWLLAVGAQSFYQLSRRRPALVRRMLRRQLERQLPAGYDVVTHFTPRYDPWDQRLCAAPDGDFFAAIRSGRASVVTDRIAAFTERGLRLESGAELEADVIVTATGLEMLFLGGIALAVDGKTVEPASLLVYRGMMLEGVPNLAFAIGYTNAGEPRSLGRARAAPRPLVGLHRARRRPLPEVGLALPVEGLPELPARLRRAEARPRRRRCDEVLEPGSAPQRRLTALKPASRRADTAERAGRRIGEGGEGRAPRGRGARAPRARRGREGRPRRARGAPRRRRPRDPGGRLLLGSWCPVEAMGRIFDALWADSGIYRQVQVSRERQGNEFGRILTSLGDSTFNFLRWEYQSRDGGRTARVTVSNAEAWPDVMRFACEGFIETLVAASGGSSVRVTSERPAPDRVVFDVRVAG
jgi:hypothetical protein